MKITKILVSITTALLLSIVFFGTNAANASKWHVGVPKTVSGHSWASKFKKIKASERYDKQYYIKYYASGSKDIGFSPMTTFFDKHKKMLYSGSGTSNSVPYPFYKKVGKHTYKIITGLDPNGKRSLKYDLKQLKKYGGYTLIKVHSKTKISAYVYNKDTNGSQSTSNLGVFYREK